MSATVCVLVTDLRREPIPAKRGYERDFLQETQLLHGERVTVLEEANGWCRVQISSQPKQVSEGVWIGYPGWVQQAHLSPVAYHATDVIQTQWQAIYHEPNEAGAILTHLPFGAFVHASEHDTRWIQVRLVNGIVGYMPKPTVANFIEKAECFLGCPYLWGGCSPYYNSQSECNTSVDCSALVHLLYRSLGITIPRDAKDQYAVSQPVNALQPGDLVYRANPATPERIDHVMLYESGETFIEACLAAYGVRRITSETKFGVPIAHLAHEVRLPNDVIYLGRIATH